MMKLMRASYHRYFKSRLFFICIGLSLLLGLWLGIHLYRDPNFSETHMWIAVLELALIAIFVSLQVGNEYTHGGFQRKIVSGSTKGMIFLSELLVVVTLVTFLFLLCIVPIVAINVRLIPNFNPDVAMLHFVCGNGFGRCNTHSVACDCGGSGAYCLVWNVDLERYNHRASFAT